MEEVTDITMILVVRNNISQPLTLHWGDPEELFQ